MVELSFEEFERDVKRFDFHVIVLGVMVVF